MKEYCNAVFGAMGETESVHLYNSILTETNTNTREYPLVFNLKDLDGIMRKNNISYKEFYSVATNANSNFSESDSYFWLAYNEDSVSQIHTVVSPIDIMTKTMCTLCHDSDIKIAFLNATAGIGK